MFVVVEFENQTIATVLDKWFVKPNEVLWPKPGTLSTRKLQRLLQTGSDLPNTAKAYKVIILKTTDDIMKAFKMEDRLQSETDCSSLDATEPLRGSLKRKIAPVTFSDYEVDLPTKKQQVSGHFAKAEMPKPPRAPLSLLQGGSSSSIQHSSVAQSTLIGDDENQSPSRLLSTSDDNTIRTLELGSSQCHTVDLDVHHESPPMNLNCNGDAFPPRLQPEKEQNAVCCCWKMKSTLDHILRLMQDMRSQLNALVNQKISPVTVTLPVDTIDDFIKLSAELNTRATFDQLVEYIQCSGGDSPGECIRSMMRRLMTQNVSKLMNWNGIHGRLALAKSPVKEVILEAIYQRKFSGFSREEATRIMKRFLHKLR